MVDEAEARTKNEQIGLEIRSERIGHCHSVLRELMDKMLFFRSWSSLAVTVVGVLHVSTGCGGSKVSGVSFR